MMNDCTFYENRFFILENPGKTKPIFFSLIFSLCPVPGLNQRKMYSLNGIPELIKLSESVHSAHRLAFCFIHRDLMLSQSSLLKKPKLNYSETNIKINVFFTSLSYKSRYNEYLLVN